jgi:replicative DNA helicase
MGKTAFALFMAVNAAKQGVPVCVYSLEMSREQLIFRMLGQIAEWSLRRSPREPPPRRR